MCNFNYKTMTGATTYTGVTRTFTSTVAPAAADIVAAKSIIDGATGFLLTSKYTAGKNQVASGTAGTARTDALAATQLALVKTGMKTTFAAVYTGLAAKLMSATVTDMSAGSLSLAAAAAGITALAMAF